MIDLFESSCQKNNLESVFNLHSHHRRCYEVANTRGSSNIIDAIAGTGLHTIHPIRKCIAHEANLITISLHQFGLSSVQQSIGTNVALYA